MAHIINCRFCKHRTIGVCDCIIKFGLDLEAKVKAWRLVSGQKSFPPKIAQALQTDMWKVYAGYVDLQREKDDQRRKAHALAKRLVETQEKRISVIVAKKFDFEVSLQFSCRPVIRY